MSMQVTSQLYTSCQAQLTVLANRFDFQGDHEAWISRARWYLISHLYMSKSAGASSRHRDLAVQLNTLMESLEEIRPKDLQASRFEFRPVGSEL